ncbi:hypothetical protein CEXT_576961, partial [Caerostris extrusa]
KGSAANTGGLKPVAAAEFRLLSPTLYSLPWVGLPSNFNIIKKCRCWNCQPNINKPWAV